MIAARMRGFLHRFIFGIGALGTMSLDPGAGAAELPRGKTLVIERSGECANAPAAAVHTPFGGQLRFHIGDGRIHQFFAADSFKTLVYVADDRDHVVQARERTRRFPVTTRAAWDGAVLSAAYRFELTGAELKTTRTAAYVIEIADGKCRLRSDELVWRQVQRNGSVLRDSTCRSTTSSCTVVSGHK
jgi:hypothetical protein